MEPRNSSRDTLRMPFERARTLPRSWPGPATGGAASAGPRGMGAALEISRSLVPPAWAARAAPGAEADRGAEVPAGSALAPPRWRSAGWRSPRVRSNRGSRLSSSSRFGPSRASSGRLSEARSCRSAGQLPPPWPVTGRARPRRACGGSPQSSVVPRMRRMVMPPTVPRGQRERRFFLVDATFRRSAPAQGGVGARAAWPRRRTTRPST